MRRLHVLGRIFPSKLTISAILQDEQQMKQNIIDCHEKEQKTELELAELVTLRTSKLAELEELKVGSDNND